MSDALVTSATKPLYDNGSSYGSKQVSTPALQVTDFEAGVISDIITDIAGFGTTTTRYANDYVISGAKSAKTTISAGNDGFGTFGHIYNFANAGLSNLGAGDEIWTQFKVYFPALFNFNAGGSLKLFRHYISGTDANAYIDLYMDSSTAEPALFSWRSEIWNGDSVPPSKDPVVRFNAQNDRVDLNNSTTFSRLTNHKLEVYVKLGLPGAGIVRVWLDNVLLFEDSINGTIRNADNLMVRTHLWTYWNGLCPSVDSNGDPITEQSAFYDDWIVATNMTGSPTNTDAEGNAYIGDYSG